jgi:hypothetical protein
MRGIDVGQNAWGRESRSSPIPASLDQLFLIEDPAPRRGK